MNLIVPATQDVIQIGNRIFTDVQNLIMLYAVASGTTNTNASFRKPDGTGAYQVPASKVFKIKAVKAHCGVTTASAAAGLTVGYADNDVGLNSAVAFTNGKWPGNSGSAAQTGYLTTLAGIHNIEFIYQFDVPTGKYPALAIGSTGMVTASVHIFGYEVPA